MTPVLIERRFQRVAGLGLLAALLFGAIACDPASYGAPPEEEEKEEKPAPVVVVPVMRSSIDAEVSSASTIEAEQQVTIHSESTGRVRAIAFEEGDVVAKGQLVAQVERDAQSSSFERASSQLDKAQADLDRISALFEKKAASKEELDNARQALRTAKLDQRDRRRELGDTRIVAPFDGILTERLVDEGAFVTNGQQLFSIVDFGTLVARVYVPERELDRVRIGQVAIVEGKAATGRKTTGKVVRIAPIVDAATGTVKVTISLPPPVGAAAPAAQGAPEPTAETFSRADGFLPGMYAEVTLTTDRRVNVTVVPKPALVREEEQAFVFVVEGDRVVRKLLELGLENDDFVEVLSGVEFGQRIVLAGQAGLEDGGLVNEVDMAGNPVGGHEAATEEAATAGEGVASR